MKKTLKNIAISALVFQLIDSIRVNMQNKKIEARNEEKFNNLLKELDDAEEAIRNLSMYARHLGKKLEANDIMPDEFDIVLRDALQP